MNVKTRTVLSISLILSTCVARSAPHEMQLPPIITKQPLREMLLDISNSPLVHQIFVLECEAFGYPSPRFRWTKDFKEYNHSESENDNGQVPGRGTIFRMGPRDDDEGYYQCFAENEFGVSTSDIIHVRKTGINLPEEEPRIVIYVNEGDPLSLSCTQLSGVPQPQMTWVLLSTYGAFTNINNSRVTQDPEGGLHFSNVKKEDEMGDLQYVCVAFSANSYRYNVGNRIILNVESAERGIKTFPSTELYISPSNIVALRGEELELTCIFGGNPTPEIQWFKEGRSLESGKVSYKNNGRTLIIDDVNFEDEGTYECIATNGIGYPLSKSMNVTIEASPSWINVPKSATEASDESISFDCSANGIPKPEIEWFINGIPMKDTEPNPRRKLDPSTQILRIEDLRRSDTAVFQCNASNIHGYVFHNFYLNVLNLPPDFNMPMYDVSKAVLNSNVSLKCDYYGYPKPDIKWKKEGQVLQGGRYQVLESGTLTIREVQAPDAGNYTCHASNRFGYAEATILLELIERTRIVDKPEDQAVPVGITVKFRCSAIGDSSADLKISWLFNDEPIDFYNSPQMVLLKDGTLFITGTAYNNSGVYTCIAHTDLDEDRASAVLRIEGIPDLPMITEITCENSTAVLKWEPPTSGDGRSPILDYDIQYKSEFTPDVWETLYNNITGSETFTVSLSPWANYSFRVLARNVIGFSVPSKPSEVCSTPEDIPYKNPDGVKTRGINDGELVISWNTMPMIEHNAPGFFYKVFWKRKDITSDQYQQKDINDWKQSTLTVENQPTYKPYRIKVEAHNKRGKANTKAKVIIGYSAEGVPLESPRNFRLVSVEDERSATFEWDHVPEIYIRGKLRGYKIQTWTIEEGEDRAREKTLRKDVNKALITMFRPFSRNVVRIRVFNGIHDGPPSEALEFYTPEGVPGHVDNIDGVSLGSTGLYLVWKRPTETNGVLTGYKIYYNEVQGTRLSNAIERKPEISDPKQTSAKLAGLKANTKYRVTIRATTIKGEGLPHLTEIRTSEQDYRVPDKPIFTWSHLPPDEGKAAIRIRWIPALEGYPGSNFYVQYRRKGDNVWEITEIEVNLVFIDVRGLEPGSVYEMKVFAVDGHYETESEIEEIEIMEMELCLFPRMWTGSWFQQGFQNPIQIYNGTISSKGTCYRSTGDNKFIIKNAEDGCYSCVSVDEKHHSVLQYKETYCSPDANVESLCSQLNGDAPVYSIFRLNTMPVPCPFKGKYTFSYNTGMGECVYPASSIDLGTDDSNRLLQFHACPDVHGTEERQERLVCMATWRQGSIKYLVGKLEHPGAMSDEDKFRCFVYEKIKTDYKVSQSGDATCDGLISATEGSRTMHLKKVVTPG